MRFFVDEALVNRFNARRELTLGQTTPKTFDPEAASHYEPPAAGGSLETVIAEQMARITAAHRPLCQRLDAENALLSARQEYRRAACRA